jgi:hypothetical protein
VRGELEAAGSKVQVDGVGRRSHSWGEPAGARVRSLYAVGGERAVTINAIRPAGASDHGTEVTSAWFYRPEAEPEAAQEARLSTIYDDAGFPRTAGAELYLMGDEYPHRLSGQSVFGVAADPGTLQAACFRWSLEGDPAQGGFQVVA